MNLSSEYREAVAHIAAAVRLLEKDAQCAGQIPANGLPKDKWFAIGSLFSMAEDGSVELMATQIKPYVGVLPSSMTLKVTA